MSQHTKHPSAGPRQRALTPLKLSICLASLVLATGLVTTSLAQTAPANAGGPTTFRRLNEAQYKRSIAQIFSAEIQVPGRFEPPVRAQGLLAIGDSRVAVSSSGFEQYELRAREIAAQVLSEERRATFVTCTPRSPRAFDTACATAFFTQYGRALYRRPLNPREMASTIALARAATTRTNDFYKGLEIGLSRLLASPNFIFRAERSEADPANPGAQRLDNYSLASRVSFLLWDAPPDAELADAANRGVLYNPGELERQVDRMIASPRFADGTRAFFSDMLGYDQFDRLTKDQTIYPHFTSQLAEDAREQTLRTVVDTLVTRNGDYRQLFTTRDTFMNRRLAALYRVPIHADGVDNWAPYTFSEREPRAGVLTLAAFLMLDATHEGRSSPTIRGKTVRELFLCQRVPDPPPNVDFSAVEGENAVHSTARERLAAHNNMPACRSCHMLTDPIGLGLENYDAVGGYRTHENGVLIDSSGTYDGAAYTNAMELGQRISATQTATNCAVRRAFEYGVGRPAESADNAWLRFQNERFAADNYSFPGLMRRIATSSAFQAVSNTDVAAAPATTSN